MFQIHTGITDSLIADVASNPKGKRFSRALWLDIEQIDNRHTLVLRGLDKVLPDAQDSTAKESEDSHLHNQLAAKASESGIFWTTADYVADDSIRYGGYWKPRGFKLASFDDAEQAEQVCAELLAFYADAAPSEEGNGLLFSDRWDALTGPAKEIMAVLLSVFGSSPTAEMLKTPGNIGSWADYLASKAKKAKPAPSRQSIEQIKAEAQAELMQRIAAQLASQPGNNQAQLMAIIAQLQVPVSAK